MTTGKKIDLILGGLDKETLKKDIIKILNNKKELKELKKIAELKGVSLEEQTKESVIDYFISKCLKHKISLDDSVYEKISLFWSKDYVDSLKEIFKNNN